MPIAKDIVERHVAKLNERRLPHEHVRIESYEPPGRFVLSFPERALPEGQCIDQDFTEIQWALHEEENIDTGIQGGRLDESEGRYHMLYEVIEWD